jgi:hypothetical protein
MSLLKFFYKLPSIQGAINGTHFTIIKSIGPLSEILYYCAKLEVTNNIVCDIVIYDKFIIYFIVYGTLQKY